MIAHHKRAIANIERRVARALEGPHAVNNAEIAADREKLERFNSFLLTAKKIDNRFVCWFVASWLFVCASVRFVCTGLQPCCLLTLSTTSALPRSPPSHVPGSVQRASLALCRRNRLRRLFRLIELRMVATRAVTPRRRRRRLPPRVLLHGGARAAAPRFLSIVRQTSTSRALALVTVSQTVAARPPTTSSSRQSVHRRVHLSEALGRRRLHLISVARRGPIAVR